MTFRTTGYSGRSSGPDQSLDHASAMEVLFDLLGEELPLSTGWTSIRCIDPDHDDSTKSASVNPVVGGYRCHACGLSGDAFGLYQHFYDASFADARVALVPDTARDAGSRTPAGAGQSGSAGVGSRDWL